jgi:hypothetical protein
MFIKTKTREMIAYSEIVRAKQHGKAGLTVTCDGKTYEVDPFLWIDEAIAKLGPHLAAPAGTIFLAVRENYGDGDSYIIERDPVIAWSFADYFPELLTINGRGYCHYAEALATAVLMPDGSVVCHDAYHGFSNKSKWDSFAEFEAAVRDAAPRLIECRHAEDDVNSN